MAWSTRTARHRLARCQHRPSARLPVAGSLPPRGRQGDPRGAVLAHRRGEVDPRGVLRRPRRSLSAPETHPALFSDHGVVHARDVAAGTLELADVVDGRLLPARPADRREFVDGSRGPDRLHPRRGDERSDAAKAVGSTRSMRRRCRSRARWTTCWHGSGRAAARSSRGSAAVGAVAPFRVPGDVVLRELAALALAHSKSMVPATLHGDFARLRSMLQRAVLVELEEHRRAGARLNPDDELPDPLGANGRWYADPVGDAFAWLDSPDPGAQRARGRRRRRGAAGARGGRAAPAWHGAANGRRVRDLRRRRDGPGGVLAAYRRRRPAVSAPVSTARSAPGRRTCERRW